MIVLTYPVPLRPEVHQRITQSYDDVNALERLAAVIKKLFVSAREDDLILLKCLQPALDRIRTFPESPNGCDCRLGDTRRPRRTRGDVLVDKVLQCLINVTFEERNGG